MIQNKKANPLMVTLFIVSIILLMLLSFIGGMIFSNRFDGVGMMSRMIGSGGMMNGNMNGMMIGNSAMGNMDKMMEQQMTASARLVNNAQLKQLVKTSEQGSSMDRNNNTITYTGQSIDIVALASPSGKPDMTWDISGFVNPTVIVPQNSQVHFTIVNTDSDELHGLELTQTAPPYTNMPMMSVNNDFLLMPVPQRTTESLSSAEYYTRSGQLHLQPGTYYYLCPVPGHAQKGMHGVLKVK